MPLRTLSPLRVSAHPAAKWVLHKLLWTQLGGSEPGLWAFLEQKALYQVWCSFFRVREWNIGLGVSGGINRGKRWLMERNEASR